MLGNLKKESIILFGPTVVKISNVAGTVGTPHRHTCVLLSLIFTVTGLLPQKVRDLGEWSPFPAVVSWLVREKT